MVLPSMLAALGSAGCQETPRWSLRLDAHTTSIAILNENQLQLSRTWRIRAEFTITGEQLAERSVFPRWYFFRIRII